MESCCQEKLKDLEVAACGCVTIFHWENILRGQPGNAIISNFFVKKKNLNT
jgi:hypothetical protein